MHAISITDILTALRHTDPDTLAAAIYADNDPELLAHLSDTLTTATEHVASHPHPDVIREADALLSEVLRWPVADALPPGHHLPTASELAAARRISTPEAERLLHRIAATDTLAARRLMGSGVEPNFTLEQTQVTACIRDIVTAGGIPTRASVRTHALAHARAAMRPGDGTEPIITSPGLPPRIASPSPMAVVPGWLDRMDTDPPLTGLLEDRISYLCEAKRAMGTATRQHTAALRAVEHARLNGTSAPPPPSGAIGAGYPQRLAV
jgi:hypothetical protein